MLILCTDSLRGYGLHRIFEIAKKANFEGIDLAVHYELFDTFNPEYINKLSLEYNIPIYSISAPANISNKQIEDLVTLTKAVNAKILILQPPRILDHKLASWMKKEIPKLREKEKISIALENSPADSYFFGLFSAHALAKSDDLKKFKHVCLDTSRLGEKNQDLIRTYQSFKSFLVTLHISNIDKGKKYAMLDSGILPLESLLSKLKQDNFPGSISLKVLPKFLNAGNEEKVFEKLKKAREFVDRYYTNLDIPKSTESQLDEIKIEE